MSSLHSPEHAWHQLETRRQFFGRSARGLGAAALASLAASRSGDALASSFEKAGLPTRYLNHAPKAKRAIYLFMSGAPSQMDMWDHKPKMQELFDKDLPDEVRGGQRLTGMTSKQFEAEL